MLVFEGKSMRWSNGDNIGCVINVDREAVAAVLFLVVCLWISGG